MKERDAANAADKQLRNNLKNKDSIQVITNVTSQIPVTMKAHSSITKNLTVSQKCYDQYMISYQRFFKHLYWQTGKPKLKLSSSQIS